MVSQHPACAQPCSALDHPPYGPHKRNLYPFYTILIAKHYHTITASTTSPVVLWAPATAPDEHCG